jgi:hypothetical protein
MGTAALRLGLASPTTVEALLARIDALARERQELRSHQAANRTLERNRLQLVRSQWELSRALVARYMPATR